MLVELPALWHLHAVGQGGGGNDDTVMGHPATLSLEKLTLHFCTINNTIASVHHGF